MSLINFFKSVGEPWEKRDEMNMNTIHEQFSEGKEKSAEE